MVYRALLCLFLSALLLGCSQVPVSPTSDAPSTDDTPRIVADLDPTDPAGTIWNGPLPDGYGDVPLVVVLYSYTDYQGTAMTVPSDVADLARFNYAERAMSASVMRGPGYDAYIAAHGKEPTVTLFADPNFLGKATTIDVGPYSGLAYDFRSDLLPMGLARSVRFNDTAEHPLFDEGADTDDSYRKIPLIVEAYEGPHFSGRAQVHVVSASFLTNKESIPAITGRGDVQILRATDPDLYWTLHVVDTVYYQTRGERWRHRSDVYTTLPEQLVTRPDGTSVLLAELPVTVSEVYENQRFWSGVLYDDSWTRSDDRISSLRILPGPDYDSAKPSKVNIWKERNFSGPGMTLGVGDYESLDSLGFDNSISSIQIVP